jgi:hypothetical protein
MNEELDSTLKSLKELKNSISLISKELDKLEIKFKNLFKDFKEEPLLNKEQSLHSLVSKEKKDKPKKIVVHRLDDTESETLSDKSFQPTKYDIKVVGLGVEKIKE